MSRFHAPIAEQIWDMKYRFKEADGTPIDGSVEDSWRRIARGTPLAVLPRPGWTRRALAGRAASVLRHHRRDPGALLTERFARHAPWCLVPAREHTASATAIRQTEAAGGLGERRGP